MKKLPVLIMLIFLISLSVSAQTMQLEIKKWDNTETKIQLSNIQNLVFSGADMQVNLKNANPTVLPKSEVRKMVFSVYTGTTIPGEVPAELKLYPNPAISSFQLSSLSAQNNLVSVYSISGQVLIQKNITSLDEKIDISDIPSGIYLVKVNDQVLKLTKK